MTMNCSVPEPPEWALRDAPTLTDLLLGPLKIPQTNPVANPVTNSLTPPLEQLEKNVVEALQGQISPWVQKQVFESVVPGFTMLADHLAAKAAQEISAQLSQQLQSEIATQVHTAVQGAVLSGVSQ